MAVKSSGVGLFTIPTAPSVGVATAQSGTANTYGSYVQSIASTAAALFIIGIQYEATTTQVPTYLNVNIGTGAGGSETTVGQVQCPVVYTAGAASTQVGGFVPIWPPIPVANATRIATKTASSVASAVSWNISLQCVAQASVVAEGTINETVNVIQVNSTNQTARDIGASVLLSAGTGAGQLDFTSGVVKANATQLLGTAWLTPAVAGTPDVNAKLHGGTSQTGRDIGASVLLSTGTGTGQLDFTSGVVKANLAQILGTALTETSGLLAAGFKQFFNISSPTSTMNTITTVTTATNLTNAPTSGDLTATMKTSVTTAATAASPTAAAVTGAVGSVTGAVGSVTGSVASVTGAVGSVTGNVGGNVVGSVASVSGTVGSVTGNVGGSVASVTAGVTVTTNNDKTGYALSTAGILAIWHQLTAAVVTTATMGKLIVDYLDAAISSRSSYAGGDTSGTTTLLSRLTGTRATNLDNLDAAVSTRSTYSGGAVASVTGAVGSVTAGVTVTTNNDKTGYTVSTVSDKTGYALTSAYDPAKTAAQAGDAMALTSGERNSISDVVWDEATSGHTTSGTTGKAVADAGSGGTPLDAAGVRTALGLATANLDTQLDALPTNAELTTALGTADDATLAAVSTLQTTATAIKTKTDSLTFTKTGEVDANTKSVVSVTVTGTGTNDDPWGP